MITKLVEYVGKWKVCYMACQQPRGGFIAYVHLKTQKVQNWRFAIWNADREVAVAAAKLWAQKKERINVEADLQSAG